MADFETREIEDEGEGDKYILRQGRHARPDCLSIRVRYRKYVNKQRIYCRFRVTGSGQNGENRLQITLATVAKE